MFTDFPENGQFTEITIVRNFFWDNDHAIIIKDGAYGTIVNNTSSTVDINCTGAQTINSYTFNHLQIDKNGVTVPDGSVFPGACSG